jgi:nucleoid-associated protein YgaU
MPTGRWKKLAIAGAILIVGIGTALVFRREPSEESLAGKAPGTMRQPAATGAAQQHKPQAEPSLAGRIEPYSPPAAEPVRDATAGFASPPENPATPTDSPIKRQTVRRPEETEATAFSQPIRTTMDPFAASSSTNVSKPPSEKRHKIVDGDTLAALARRYLGEEQRRLDLFEYNRDILTTPELLPIGKELRIPPPDFMPVQSATAALQPSGLTAVVEPPSTSRRRPSAASARAVPIAQSVEPPPAKTYVVQQHDTLALIARKLFGDISRQEELMAANRGLLRSAKDLRAGMTLVVPTAPQGGRPYDGLPTPSN